MKQASLLLLAILLLFLGAGMLSLNQMIIYTPDSARYLAWANSLSRFDGFLDITSPEPVRYVVHAPLYPLLLAPVMWIAPMSVVGAKIMTLVLALVTVALFFLWLGKSTDRRWAAFGVLLFAFNPLMLIYSTQVLSEIPFALCLMMFFLFGDQLIRREKVGFPAEFGFLASVVAALFLREVGLTLMMGSAAYFFWQRHHRRAWMILLMSLLVYLLWFLRNEVVVAGIENPPMRNTRLFFTHLYTPNDASLFLELGSRLVSNLSVYSKLIGRLLLFPDFVPRSHLLVSTGHPLVGGAMALLSVAQYPFMILTLAIAGYGAWVQYRRPGSFPLQLVFLICYAGPIVFYPINDIRFLFPILVLMLHAAVIGMHDLFRRYPNAIRPWPARAGLTIVALLLLFPNLAWDVSYITNSWRYGHETIPFVDELRSKERYPEQFAKPLFLAGEWVERNSDPADIILCRWKELFFWNGGRPVIDMDPQTTAGTFDQIIRDYRVRYLVSVTTRGGLSEYESLMDLSAAYTFVPVFAEGNIEVHAIQPKKALAGMGRLGLSVIPKDAMLPARQRFSAGLRLLSGRSAAAAESTFAGLAADIGGYGAVIFHLGVAKEFGGKLDEAEEFFRTFRSVPQAGSYLQQAWYHLEIISRLKDAQRTVRSFDKAAKYHTVAVNYRELAFRGRAYEMLQQSMDSEESFYPSIITRALWLWQDGNPAEAGNYLREAKAIDSSNVLSVQLSNVLRLREALARESDATRKAELRLATARACIEMGMREDAISEALAAMKENPRSVAALSALAELYRAKARLLPERRSLEELAAIRPDDAPVRARLSELVRRW